MKPTTLVPAAPAPVEELPIVSEARDRLDQACMAAEDRAGALPEGGADAHYRARSLRDVVDAFDDYLAHLGEHADVLGPAAAIAARASARAVLTLLRIEQDAEAGA